MLSEQIKELERENKYLREEVQSLKEQYKGDGRKPKLCEYCIHFVRHYLPSRISPTGFCESSFGHCTQGRSPKSRTGDDKCAHFEFGENKHKYK